MPPTPAGESQPRFTFYIESIENQYHNLGRQDGCRRGGGGEEQKSRNKRRNTIKKTWRWFQSHRKCRYGLSYNVKYFYHAESTTGETRGFHVWFKYRLSVFGGWRSTWWSLTWRASKIKTEVKKKECRGSEGRCRWRWDGCFNFKGTFLIHNNKSEKIERRESRAEWQRAARA